MIMALIMGAKWKLAKGYFIIATFQFVLAFILIFIAFMEKLEPVSEKSRSKDKNAS